MFQLTMRQCRDAAEAVRRAEHGPAAVRRLRGDRLAGFFRQCPGLAVLLYLAAWQGRVVWRGLDGFALLERPIGCPDCTSPGRPARLALAASARR